MTSLINEKKFSTWKRLIIFIIDGVISLLFFAILFFTIGNFCVKKCAHSEIENMNQNYVQVCEEYNYPYIADGQYGIISLDVNKLVNQSIQEGYNSEVAFANYIKIKDKVEDILKQNTQYQDSSAKFYLYYLFEVVLCMFVSLFIFQFIIPLCMKNQTISMKIFKANIVNKKDYVKIGQYKLLLRFFIIYICEFLLVYLIANVFGLVFLILFSFVFISLSKQKLSFHDLLTKTCVILCEDSYQQ